MWDETKKGLLKVTMNIEVKIEKGSNRYNLSGLPIALQIFAFEIWLELSQRYARKLNVDLFLQMLCWTTDNESKIINED